MKKKIFQSLVLVLLLQASVMAYGSEPRQTTITCFVHNNHGSSVSLYKVENGEAVRVEFRWPRVNDSCVFSIPMEKEGIYFLRKAGSRESFFHYVIYLRPGDQKSVDIYTNKFAPDFDSCKVVKPNLETKLLQKWANFFNNYCTLGVNRSQRDRFIAGYKNLENEAQRLKKKAVTSNKYFNYLFNSKIDADVRYAKVAAFFNFGERMNAGYDSSELHKPFYQSLSPEQFCDAGLLNSEHGLELVNYYLPFNLFQKTGNIQRALSASIADKASSLCNDTVRGAFLTRHMMNVTNYEKFASEIEPFKSSFVTEEMKKAYEKKEDEITKYAKGIHGYNFSLYDKNGNRHSLSDFKGKVVVLDIWAMWCAPCLAEKPHFQKIEEEFRDRQDIVFIGVSVDGDIKKEAWKSFVTKKGWTNIELLSNFDESIMEYYKIEGIPRLMIFDKDGKIVTVDAPRPSQPEFRALIEQTLKIKS
jgi:thiol-disulfide isomerase/thioredoxin